MNAGANQLRSEVFGCEACADLRVFTRSRSAGRLFKFPPIIGAQEPAPLLFVGINPRRSETNLELHDWLMESPEAFAQLAANRQKDGRPYIAVDGEEEHYHCHMMVIEGVFGVGTAFETKAAVTEVYLCANRSGSALLANGKSPCADRHLRRVLEIVQPRVIVAVGALVRRHLEEHFRQAPRVPVLAMEHPSLLHHASPAEKRQKMHPTVKGVVSILG